MIPNPAKALLSWWQNASTRSRWVGGIVLFSLICTAALFMISDSPTTADGPVGSQAFDPSPWYMVGVLFKVIFVIALIIGAGIIARQYTNRSTLQRPSRELEVMETVRLSPRQALHLVRVGNKRVLIGATDQSFALITDLGEKEAAPGAAESLHPENALAGSTDQPFSFARVLASAEAQPAGDL